MDASEDSLTSGLGGLARGTGLFLTGFVFYTLVNFAFQLVLARSLSSTDLGRFYEATAVVGILVAVVTGGTKTSLVRFVATEDPAKRFGLAKIVFGLDLAFAVCVLAALWALAPFVAHRVFHDEHTVQLLRIGALALPFASLGLLFAAYARGSGQFRLHFLAEQVALPTTRLVVVLAVVVGAGFGRMGAIEAFVAGFAASALIGFLGTQHRWLRDRQGSLQTGRHLLARFLRFSAYRWGVDLLQAVLLWVDMVILGALRTPTVVGTYAIASRVVLVASLGLPALNLAIAPAFARELASRDLMRLTRFFGVAARWAIILTFVPLGLLIALRSEILSLFGRQFVEGGTALSLLAIGFLFNAVSGPVGTLLDMSEMNRLVLWDNLVAVVLNVALNLLLIPRLGMEGAALAWSASLILVNLMMMVQVRRYLKVRVPQMLQLRTALTMSLVTGIELALMPAGPALQVPLALVGYAMAMALTRSADELVAFRLILARLGRLRPGRLPE